jgi:hypothetical protein
MKQNKRKRTFVLRKREEKATRRTRKKLLMWKGLGTQPQKRPHHTYISGWFKNVLKRVGLSSY